MNKEYLVTYKEGHTQSVKGVIVLFSSINTTLPRPNNAVYLNADEVVSIVEQQTASTFITIEPDSITMKADRITVDTKEV